MMGFSWFVLFSVIAKLLLLSLVEIDGIVFVVVVVIAVVVGVVVVVLLYATS